MYSSLDELYELQYHLHGLLKEKKYQALSLIFNSIRQAKHSCLPAGRLALICSLDFLFPQYMPAREPVHAQLLAWHFACPEDATPCLLLAESWFAIAHETRLTGATATPGGQPVPRVVIANAAGFAWAIQAIASGSYCAKVFMLLMNAAGYLGTPGGAKNGLWPVVFSVHQFCDDALAFARQFGALPLDKGPVSLALRLPTYSETRFPALYWFNRTLEYDPTNIAVREQWVQLLSPLYYGDSRYQAVNHFLSSEHCQSLGLPERNQLWRMKIYDKINNPVLWPLPGKTYRIRRLDAHFRRLLALPLHPEAQACGYQAYARFCQHFLLNRQGRSWRLTPWFAGQIVQCVTALVKIDAPCFWLMHSDQVFSLLALLLENKLAPEAEIKQVLVSVVALTRARGSSVFDALLTLLSATQRGVAGLKQALPASQLLTLQSRIQQAAAGQLWQACNNLVALGYGQALGGVLLQAAQQGGRQAALFLADVQSGANPQALSAMALPENLLQAQYVFIQAGEQGDAHARFLHSRLLERLIGRTSKPSEITRLVLAREKLLYQSQHAGHALARYDYACALALSDSPEKVQQGLEQHCPAILLSGNISGDYRAYIAYLFAFCALHGRGMAKNLWLVDFWIQRAWLWSLSPRYLQFRDDVVSRYPLYMLYRRRVKMHQKSVPEWQIRLIRQLGFEASVVEVLA
ncbi:DUF4034 domain-containing protein [Mangrovibacter yixingensis]|uniref:DUF4034 domain-containing protein n=1 Tax=Mangrovibacter yixingensis TaxID=1529639 RepID=UPI001CFB4AE7|nr:DUF4034 domain-containing protein [Mangrovibacter yixingensis]